MENRDNNDKFQGCDMFLDSTIDDINTKYLRGAFVVSESAATQSDHVKQYGMFAKREFQEGEVLPFHQGKILSPW